MVRTKDTPPVLLTDEAYMEFLLSEANVKSYTSEGDAKWALWVRACAQYISRWVEDDGSFSFDPKSFIDMIPRSIVTQLGFASASWALVRALTTAYNSNEYYDVFYAMRCRLMGRPEMHFKVWDSLFPMRAVPYNELADEVMDQLKEWQDENAYRKPMPQRKDIVFVLRQMRFVSLMARLMAEKEERWRS